MATIVVLHVNLHDTEKGAQGTFLEEARDKHYYDAKINTHMDDISTRAQMPMVMQSLQVMIGNAEPHRY